MPDLLIRGLSAETIKRLKAKAKRNGRTLQGEAKAILEEHAAKYTMPEFLAVAEKWRKTLGKSFSDSVDLIREDRER